jgi:hypothetical protein
MDKCNFQGLGHTYANRFSYTRVARLLWEYPEDGSSHHVSSV